MHDLITPRHPGTIMSNHYKPQQIPMASSENSCQIHCRILDCCKVCDWQVRHESRALLPGEIPYKDGIPDFRIQQNTLVGRHVTGS